MAYDPSKDKELQSFTNQDETFKVALFSYDGKEPKLALSKKTSTGQKTYWKSFTRLNIDETKFMREVLDNVLEYMIGFKTKE